MTLWELARMWQHTPQRKLAGGEWECCAECQRCQLEAWAREHKEKWGNECIELCTCEDDLGVPPEEQK